MLLHYESSISFKFPLGVYNINEEKLRDGESNSDLPRTDC